MNKDLINFIKKSTSSFLCVKEIEKRLKEKGFKKINEEDTWDLKNNKYYTIRNDSSIIAFELSNNESFNIITTHCDTPSLLLKPNGSYIKDNYLKYNVMPYGGLLNYGWLDHPLSISGRVVIKENNKLKIKLIDLEKPLFIVPSVAIHQNANANSNLDLNMQNDLIPIVSISKNSNDFNKLLNKYIKGKIIDYDLFLYNPIDPSIIGINNEILVSPRIDNLTSVYSSLTSFLNSKSNNIKVFVSFNSEEIGSLTLDGADSNFLLDTLKKIAANRKFDISSSLSNSFIISSDNTHAVHPSHNEYSDYTTQAYMGEGLTIIREPNSTTNSISSSIIKMICDKNHIKYQYSTSKNDISTGSTLASISLSHVSVLTVDLGIPELSMHSSIETCSMDDIKSLYKLMKSFYETRIIRKGNGITIE